MNKHIYILKFAYLLIKIYPRFSLQNSKVLPYKFEKNFAILLALSTILLLLLNN
jgi:hypothetical protein